MDTGQMGQEKKGPTASMTPTQREIEETIANGTQVRYDGYRQSYADYGTYRPSLKSPKEKMSVGFCVHMYEDNQPSGIYRIATAGKDSLHIPFDLPSLLGKELLINQKFELVVSPESIRFKENCMHTSWYSFNEMLEARRVAIIDETLNSAEATELAITSLNANPDYSLSYRFELIVPKKRNTLAISVRALPANAAYLNDSEHLSGHDVGSMHVYSFDVATITMPSFCSDLKNIYPCAPVTFTHAPIDMQTYKSLIINGMQPLMHRYRVHADHTCDEARLFMKSPKAKSGNILRFPEFAQPRKRSHDEMSGGPSGSTEDLCVSDSELLKLKRKANSDMYHENLHNTKMHHNMDANSINRVLTSVPDNSSVVPPTHVTTPSVSPTTHFNPAVSNNFQTQSSHEKNQSNKQSSEVDYSDFDGNTTVRQMRMSIDDLRVHFPNLNTIEYFDKLSAFTVGFMTIGFLAQEECKHIEKSCFNPPKSLEDNLRKNEDKVYELKNYEGQDNCNDVLHDVRFLRGSCASSTSLFVEASNRMSHRPLPVLNMDFSHLRQSYQIATSTYTESHNLDSQKISLKQFTAGSFAKSTQGISKFKILSNNGDDPEVINQAVLEDVTDLKEFRAAFFWFTVLRRRIISIDYSVESIELFLIENNYFETETCNYKGLGRGSVNPGKFCALLCDHLIRVNNYRFSKNKPHLTTEEMSLQFEAFCYADKRFQDNRPQQAFRSKGNEASGSGTKSGVSNNSGIPQSKIDKTHCKWFNTKNGVCTRDKHDDGRKCIDQKKVVREHSCNHSVDGKICSKPHKKYEH